MGISADCLSETKYFYSDGKNFFPLGAVAKPIKTEFFITRTKPGAAAECLSRQSAEMRSISEILAVRDFFCFLKPAPAPTRVGAHTCL
ncbi:hypothetical protein COW82_02805 [Candidatus Campbellbacteria bacterium CG22_combo_CG10-13_8_21_14_all_43_18]|uniref:Uncharacterized protein n=1 Tax=Candidatus Campbellbacteria bacterium CG22_combo_CG10-13_8_21_14_all_43_18 TaxID=1974530 RepID=A0A2H0DX44_9BACT|nr:MAG: hypothetical protein COW82_02805 [Candidatus Campbellbacteria bacterium CG22_combo_CG10-13_8_21_14_all_43_18]